MNLTEICEKRTKGPYQILTCGKPGDTQIGIGVLSGLTRRFRLLVRCEEPDTETETTATALYFVLAANHFEEVLGACKSALRALEDNLRPGPMDEDSKVALRLILSAIEKEAGERE